MDPVFARIEEELQRRKERHLVPGDWYALGRAIGVTKQVIGNWKSRGVPRTSHEAIADVFGWSVDLLLGREPQSDGSTGEPATAPNSALSPTQVAAIYAMLDEPEKQLFERLLLAAGFKLPGVNVEVELWGRNDKSGVSPLKISLEPHEAKPAKPVKRASK